MLVLNEYTRSQLLKKSKDKGFNRFDRRMNVDQKEVKIDKVVIGEITNKSPSLDLYFKVRDYTCSIRLINFMERVRQLNIQSKHRNDLRKMINIALMNTLNKNDVLINCSCPDFYYRFSYTATVKGYGFNTNQTIPSPIRNPKLKGSGCKHLTRILNAPSLWKGKVITAVALVLESNPLLYGGEIEDRRNRR